jgi:CP family cyanate transporter-like MFS transporter
VVKGSKILSFIPYTNPYRWRVLAGVWLSYYCFGLTIVTLAPLVSEISSDLHLTHSQIGTVLGAWQLVYIGSAIPLGILLDRIGTRRAMMFAIVVIAISAALRSVSGGYGSLFLAVAMFGLGGPLISIGAPKLIGLWFEGKERGLAMGIYMTAPTLGSITGLSLTNSLFMPMFEGDWRSVLLLYAVFIVIASILWWLITSHKDCKAVESNQGASVKESQKQNFLRLIKIPALQIVLAMSVGIFFFNHGLNNWLPEILRSKGMSATQAGYLASVPAVFAVMASLTIPRLAIPGRRIWILGILFMSCGLSSLMLQVATGPILPIALVLQGLARGSAITLSILVLLDIPEIGSKRAGVAGGMFFSTAEIGGVMGPVSIGILSDMSGGFSSALYMLTAVSAALLMLLAALRRHKT